MDKRNWTKGESAVVKPDVTDPDTGRTIGGWQGRVSAIFDEMGTLTILWDSHTLESMTLSHIAWCEEEGMSWSEMNLFDHDVEPATARDTEDDVARTIAEIESRSSWLHLGGEQGKRVQEIVNRAQDRGEFAVFRTWHAHLEEHLVFPFAATVVEHQRGPVRQGARVKVLDITFLDETYGTIVAVKQKDEVHELPLCDLEVTDADVENRQLVEDYAVWFANR